MRKHKMKKSLSMKTFILELGENFSGHIANRLLDLEVRSVLTRKDDFYTLNLKHVEHTKYDDTPIEEDTPKTPKKEFTYGEFIVQDGDLYFSENCDESETVMQSPSVNAIYEALSGPEITLEDGKNAKKIDDSNIDFVVDSILTACPQITQEYFDIISQYRKIEGFTNNKVN